MADIIAFPTKNEDRRTTVRGLKNAIKHSIEHTSIIDEVFIKAVLGMFDSPYLKDFPDQYFDFIELEIDNPPNEPNIHFTIKTLFRSYLVPEFGTQTDTKFVSLTSSYITSAEVMDIPPDLFDKAHAYFKSYPPVNSVLTLLYLALLGVLVEQPGVEMLKLDTEDEDGLSFVFCKQDDEGLRGYALAVDFFPILLDDAANRYHDHMLEQEDSTSES